MTSAGPAPAGPATATIATEIAIAREIGEVWRTLLDFPAYGEWNPYMVRIDGEARAGTVIEVHTLKHGTSAPLVQKIELVSVEPHAMRWQGGLPDRRAFAGDHWFALSATGPSESLFRHYEHFTGTRLAEFLAGYEKTVTRNFHLFNEALKARCENRAMPDHRGE